VNIIDGRLRHARALQSDGENVALSCGLVHPLAIGVDQRAKGFIAGFNAHTGLNEVVVDSLGALSFQVSAQPSDSRDPSAQNPASRKNVSFWK
jgi:hypothetical protein